MHFHQQWTRACMLHLSKSAPAEVTRCCHCWNAPPTPHCAHIHCFAFIGVQQVSLNVSGCHFFHMEEFSDTFLLHIHFHVRRHFVRLPLSAICHMATCNGILVGRFSGMSAIPPISISDVMRQCSKAGGITFQGTLVLQAEGFTGLAVECSRE